MPSTYMLLILPVMFPPVMFPPVMFPPVVFCAITGVAIITTLSAATIVTIMKICFKFIAYMNYLGVFFLI